MLDYFVIISLVLSGIQYQNELRLVTVTRASIH